MMHFRHHGNGKMVPDVKIILRGDSVIKKEMIAMLLAGGQGSRLGVLTSKVAKPAVAFGGKYRIIDFPLSNCINSVPYFRLMKRVQRQNGTQVQQMPFTRT